MHSLPYSSAFQPYLVQKLPTTTAPTTGFVNMPAELDLHQLLTLAAMAAVDSDRTISPSSPESTAESPPSMVPFGTISPTLKSLSLNELFSQPTNGALSFTKSHSVPLVSSPKATREARIKRPMNAFMVWSQERRQQISASGKKFHNSDISKMLGAEWRKMEEDDKIPYVERAKLLREEHLQQYPDYVYRPRRRKRVEKSSGSVDSVSTDESSSPPIILNPAALISSSVAQLFLQLILKNQQMCTSPPEIIDSSLSQSESSP